MKYLSLIPLIIILSGCSTSLEKAEECERSTPGVCEKFWEEWREDEYQKFRQEQWDKLISCPPHHFFYCDNDWCRSKSPPSWFPDRLPKPVENVGNACIRVSMGM